MDFNNPEGWPRAPGYSHAVSASGRQVHTAGQIGINPISHELAAGTIVDEARQALENLVAALAAGGARPDQIQSINWYVTDKQAYLDNAREIGGVYREVIGKHFPAITMVEVSGLMLEGAHMEISAIACVED